MISWYWLIPTAMLAGSFGCLIMALFAAQKKPQVKVIMARRCRRCEMRWTRKLGKLKLIKPAAGS
jgi:hypothetical protein